MFEPKVPLEWFPLPPAGCCQEEFGLVLSKTTPEVVVGALFWTRGCPDPPCLDLLDWLALAKDEVEAYYQTTYCQ